MMTEALRRTRFMCAFLGGIVFFLCVLSSSVAGVVPTDGSHKAAALPSPSPSVFTWHGPIAYYNGFVIYAGSDGQIYAYDLSTNSSSVVCDTRAFSTEYTSATGFLVSDDGYLYFHDNGLSTNLYRVLLTDPWPASYTFFDTQCDGYMYALTQNPWTGAVWFSSAGFGAGNLYLYEVSSSFDSVVERASFAKPHGENAGSGPIIFKERDTILYGESVWNGDGYFHLLDATTGAIVEADYLTFSGGLVSATYGYDHGIFVTTGVGKAVLEVQGAAADVVATTDEDAQGIAFDGFSFYISEQTSSDFSGTVSLWAFWQWIPTGTLVGQGAPAGMVEGDLAVVAKGVTGSKAIGIGAGDSETFVDFMDAIDPSTINDNTNRPGLLAFGLVRFRLKVTDPDGTATVTVYLSEEAPVGAKWYKYDTIQGWYDYSSRATLSADRRSFTLEFKDGGYGDADRIVNGYISDPGGVGTSSGSVTGSGDFKPASSGPGGGSSGCFIGVSSSATIPMGAFFPFLFLIVVTKGWLVFQIVRKGAVFEKCV